MAEARTENPGADANADRPPLIAHIILRLSIGGMENGLVNIINRTPPDRFRHAVICLEGADDFQTRIVSQDVQIFSLNKKPGQGLSFYISLWRLLRELAPDIVHTRNLPTIDLMPVVRAAGIGARVHGEHGHDSLEMQGDNAKYNLIRRLVSPLVQAYVPVSQDLANWLATVIKVPNRKIQQIYNGVDTARFRPASADAPPRPDFAPPGTTLFGTVGRLEAVKDQTNLARAFVRLCEMLPAHRSRLRLAIVGEGSLKPACLQILAQAGLAQQAWLPGARDDIPQIMRQIDIFVLPSIYEGISNTILEAMASGCPVIATAVGGNVELVRDGRTGFTCPPSDPAALAATMARFIEDPGLREKHGIAARDLALGEFDLDAMVERYLSVYTGLLSA